ncbi:MAG: hypothetical protein HQK60_19345, partial [Deltaproteobacteria bacterium]|nr:hypothetical protein [Deltaproteobacteria bacterium]
FSYHAEPTLTAERVIIKYVCRRDLQEGNRSSKNLYIREVLAHIRAEIDLVIGPPAMTEKGRESLSIAVKDDLTMDFSITRDCIRR